VAWRLANQSQRGGAILPHPTILLSSFAAGSRLARAGVVPTIPYISVLVTLAIGRGHLLP